MSADDAITPEERIAALEQELKQLKIAALEEEVSRLKAESAAAAPRQPAEGVREAGSDDLRGAFAAAVAAAPPLPPPPAPPPPEFERFPDISALGVGGQRCVLIFYAYDGIPKAEALLETFEDEAAECAACGCALVAVRRVVPTNSADVRKDGEYRERFPSLNLVDGLEALAPRLGGASPALAKGGLNGEWQRTLYYEPLVVLLEPDGGMRAVLSHKGLSANNVLGNVMRALHLAVPRGAEARVSNAESEANTQALYNENVAWAEVLKEDESLRQPTRSWFDGVFTGRDDERPLLAGVDAAALPEALERYMAGEGEEEDEEEYEELVSADGVKAPAWYAKAKRAAEKKQAAEREMYDGIAPSATPGPFAIGPAGRRLEPTKKALEQASAQQGKLVQAFFTRFGAEDALKALTGGGAAAAPLSSDAAAGGTGPVAPRTATTESALLRAEMLSLGLARSTDSTQPTRRLRLLRELEASVRELEAERFDDRAALTKFKAQIRESYAAAPKEFIDEARRRDRFNEALPPLTPAEIAAEFASLADGGKRVVERALATPDFESLNPGRKRGPREQGNKIEIAKPAAEPSEDGEAP